MRVRVWIEGPDGPSRDFELVSAPRVGERITIACAGELHEGVVEAVHWQLQAADSTTLDLALDTDPPGSVSVVQVLCRPPQGRPRQHVAAEDVDVELVRG